MHDLRHTHASLILAAGDNVKVVRERLGHARITVRSDVYGHAIPGMRKGAADRFAERLQRRFLRANVDTWLAGRPTRRALFKRVLDNDAARRDGRVDECGGLENRCPDSSGPWVRIPLPPPIA